MCNIKFIYQLIVQIFERVNEICIFLPKSSVLCKLLMAFKASSVEANFNKHMHLWPFIKNLIF